MTEIFNTIAPVFSIILLGYMIKHSPMIPKTAWDGLERITYYVFLPSLLFHTFSTQKNDLAIGKIAIIVTVLFIIITIITFIVGREALRLPNKTFASFFQGCIRFNNYIGLSIISPLFGAKGLAINGVIILIGIPIANFLTLAVMAHYADEKAFSIKKVVYQTVFNPLVMATIFGVLAASIPVSFTVGAKVIEALSAAALPIGVLCIGAALDLKHVLSAWGTVLVSCIIKLLTLPLITLLILPYFNLSATEQAILIIFAAMPCATSCYVVSKQMKADVEIMASITAMMMLLSIFTISFWLKILNI